MSVGTLFKTISEESQIMKTSFGKKSLLVLIASASMLTACNNPSNSQNAPSSSSQSPVEDTTSGNSQLPDSVNGTYALAEEGCSAKTVTISSKGINLGQAFTGIVNKVTSGDGSYDVTYDLTGMWSDEKDPSNNLMKLRLAPLSRGEGLVLQEFDETTDTLIGEKTTLKKCG